MGSRCGKGKAGGLYGNGSELIARVNGGGEGFRMSTRDEGPKKTTLRRISVTVITPTRDMLIAVPGTNQMPSMSLI